MAMVQRPVNIQASRDIVLQFRGGLLGQPYLTSVRKARRRGDRERGRDAVSVTFRLLTYNIWKGGVGRVDAIARVIDACHPDVVLLQEATRPEVVKAIAAQTGMSDWRSMPRQSLAFLSRAPVEHAAWHRPRFSRHAFLEIVPRGLPVRCFGLHLSAVHAAWTERRRTFELRALLDAIEAHRGGFHVLAGDFNTLAPGQDLELKRLPARLRPLVWLSGGRVKMADHPHHGRGRLSGRLSGAAS